MFKILLALHLVFAVFAIGPLTYAASTATRGIRRGEAAMCAASARMLRTYSVASLLVVALGIGLLGVRETVTVRIVGLQSFDADDLQSPVFHSHVASFGDVWIWLSLVLWGISLLAVFAVAAPVLSAAGRDLATGNARAGATARVAASGLLVTLIYVAIVFLMVYRPR